MATNKIVGLKRCIHDKLFCCKCRYGNNAALEYHSRPSPDVYTFITKKWRNVYFNSYADKVSQYNKLV